MISKVSFIDSIHDGDSEQSTAWNHFSEKFSIVGDANGLASAAYPFKQRGATWL